MKLYINCLLLIDIASYLHKGLDCIGMVVLQTINVKHKSKFKRLKSRGFYFHNTNIRGIG